MSAHTDVLAVPMQDNDAGADTVRDYLLALLRQLWTEEEWFSGKRPFGNSGWQDEVYNALAVAGLIEPEDYSAGDRLVMSAIDALGAKP